jgi:uncharacterized membrane protein
MDYSWLLLSIIIVLLYITFRYYLRTDYKGKVDTTTFVVTVLIIGLLWRFFKSRYRSKMYF